MGKGLRVALLIAFVTVLAFDIGMGRWMLVMHYLPFMPPLRLCQLISHQVG